MKTIIKQFSELTTDELYEILKLRVDVFVVEQACPYPELDEKDRDSNSYHIFISDENGNITAYCRVLPPGLSYPQASIGRVLVAQAYRNQRLATQLMQKAIDCAKNQWPQSDIQLGAQEYLVDFYQSLGFTTNSDMYLEDGLPHRDMLLTYQK
ncbi:GNAT family N-acetyltransferase [Parashewanella curva]|uniref:Protein ElaA n=1 Tax=Parashewanella curva TaxID=2338552 RepID=A0A3L8Q155_9GAMM|nr:GNAT family N-acetyltransferase [Parashewanella curva]RLV60453.1 GNAT family N-acetyltransferase [Parashewanella curva]